MSNRDDADEVLSFIAAVVDEEVQKGLYRVGDRVALRAAIEWGGEQIYFSMGKARKAREMYRRFNGNNIGKLARMFHMSKNRARTVINKERARQVKERQLSLLDIAR
jgi:Mor family transcriptional regulator